MSFLTYSKYKTVEALGFTSLPDLWTLTKVKHLFQIGRGRVISQEELVDSATYPVYSSQTQDSGILGYIDTYDFNCSQLTWTTDGANAGTVFLREGKYNCTNVCGTLLPIGNKSDIKFYLYALQYLAHLHKRPDTNGAKIMNGEMAEIPLPLPPINEQTQIVRFLDHEVGKIDALIAEQEKLIALLKEKRQAVISHAVTKGLNPDVPMKDSGVEWLGQVPEHWSVKRVKHFGRVIGGFAFKSGDFVTDGYPVLKITNISHFEIDLSDLSYLPEHYAEEYKDYLAPEGALLFAMTRPVISGGIKVSLNVEGRPLVNQRVGFMQIADFKMAKYILESTQSDSFYAQFCNNMTVTNQPNISSEGIESIYFPVPPTSELDDILTHIEQLSMKYDYLAQDVLLQINILQERRSALISAAVTGKIDVRGWQPPAAQ